MCRLKLSHQYCKMLNVYFTKSFDISQQNNHSLNLCIHESYQNDLRILKAAKKSQFPLSLHYYLLLNQDHYIENKSRKNTSIYVTYVGHSVEHFKVLCTDKTFVLSLCFVVFFDTGHDLQ